MLDIAICDRSTADRIAIGDNIKQIWFDSEIYEFENGADLLVALKGGLSIGVVFLEVSGVDSDAIETGRVLNREYPDTSVVYIGQDFFESVYDTQHEYVLLKPVHPLLLRRALNKIYAHRAKISVVVKERGTTTVISPEDIIYCERRNRRTCIVTGDSEKMTNTPIKMLYDSLGSNFIITHNSFIVNMRHIRSINNSCIELSDGSLVPVSRSKAAEVKSKLNEFFLDN